MESRPVKWVPCFDIEATTAGSGSGFLVGASIVGDSRFWSTDTIALLKPSNVISYRP